MLRNARYLWLVAIVSCLGCRTPRPVSNPVSNPAGVAVPGTQAILDAFRTHPLVLLGESHRSAETHAFLRALVGHPDFANAVDDIVIESGNTRYQALLDRYVRGDSIPRDSLRLVWRNTTQLLAWDSPLYEQFIETIRDVNRRLPVEKRMRVLAGDPPIDWSRVASSADFPRSYGYRDWQTTEIVEKEVLARGRRALVVIGAAHIHHVEPRRDTVIPPVERLGLGEALELAHPGAAYSVYTIVGKQHLELQRALAAIAAPTMLVPVSGSSLEGMSSRLLFGGMTFPGSDPARQPVFPTIGKTVDAFLYLGPFDNKILADPSVYRDDPGYLAEIRRRIRVLTQVFGGDFWSEELDQTVGAGK
jgi:hypothetical protein